MNDWLGQAACKGLEHLHWVPSGATCTNPNATYAPQKQLAEEFCRSCRVRSNCLDLGIRSDKYEVLPEHTIRTIGLFGGVLFRMGGSNVDLLKKTGTPKPIDPMSPTENIVTT